MPGVLLSCHDRRFGTKRFETGRGRDTSENIRNARGYLCRRVRDTDVHAWRKGAAQLEFTSGRTGCRGVRETQFRFHAVPREGVMHIISRTSETELNLTGICLRFAFRRSASTTPSPPRSYFSYDCVISCCAQDSTRKTQIHYAEIYRLGVFDAGQKCARTPRIVLKHSRRSVEGGSTSSEIDTRSCRSSNR